MGINPQANRIVEMQKSNIFVNIINSITRRKKRESLETKKMDDINDILADIYQAKKEWVNANINFEYVEERELVDYYTYRIKACEVKYEYLIKKAKERGIRLDSLDCAKIENIDRVTL